MVVGDSGQSCNSSFGEKDNVRRKGMKAVTNEAAIRRRIAEARAEVNTNAHKAAAVAYNDLSGNLGKAQDAMAKNLEERRNLEAVKLFGEFSQQMDVVTDSIGEDGEPQDMLKAFEKGGEDIVKNMLPGIKDENVKERFLGMASWSGSVGYEGVKKRADRLWEDEKIKAAENAIGQLGKGTLRDYSPELFIANGQNAADVSAALSVSRSDDERKLLQRDALGRYTNDVVSGLIGSGDFSSARDCLERAKGHIDEARRAELYKRLGVYEKASARVAANKERYERYGDDAEAAYREIEQSGSDEREQERDKRSYAGYLKQEQKKQLDAYVNAKSGYAAELSGMMDEGAVDDVALESLKERMLEQSGLTGDKRDELSGSLEDMYGQMLNAPSGSDEIAKAALTRSAIEGKLSQKQIDDALAEGKISAEDYLSYLGKVSSQGGDSGYDLLWLRYLDNKITSDSDRAGVLNLVSMELEGSPDVIGYKRVEKAKGEIDALAAMYTGDVQGEAGADAGEKATISRHAFEQDSEPDGKEKFGQAANSTGFAYRPHGKLEYVETDSDGNKVRTGIPVTSPYISALKLVERFSVLDKDMMKLLKDGAGAIAMDAATRKGVLNRILEKVSTKAAKIGTVQAMAVVEALRLTLDNAAKTQVPYNDAIIKTLSGSADKLEAELKNEQAKDERLIAEIEKGDSDSEFLKDNHFFYIDTKKLEQTADGRKVLNELYDAGLITEQEKNAKYASMYCRDYMKDILGESSKRYMHDSLKDSIMLSKGRKDELEEDIGDMRSIAGLHKEIKADYIKQVVDYVELKDEKHKKLVEDILDKFADNPYKGWEVMYKAAEANDDKDKMRILAAIEEKMEELPHSNKELAIE